MAKKIVVCPNLISTLVYIFLNNLNCIPIKARFFKTSIFYDSKSSRTIVFINITSLYLCKDVKLWSERARLKGA